jgi:S-disulfanyl-L-cysteine oxidoreductase SoxD
MSEAVKLMAASLVGLSAAVAACAEPAGLGRRLSAAELPAPTVFPDGTGLPAGSGSVLAGRALYAARCAACHGARGEGSNGFPPIAGGHGSLASKTPLPTVGSYWPYATTLWDYLRRAMPYAQPGSLTVEDTYSLSAYVLHLNGLLDEAAVLDADGLARIRMPNRDGFITDSRPDFPPARR